MFDHVTHNRRLWVLTIGATGLLLLALAAAATAQARRKLKTYNTKYYVLHTDAEVEFAREAAARATSMYETYKARMKRGTGAKRALYLYTDRQDYINADGTANMQGCFNSDKGVLLHVTMDHIEEMWRLLQHECWHQFSYHTISRDTPRWFDEANGVYFQFAEWTGDGYVSGQLKGGMSWPIQQYIEKKELIPFDTITRLSHEEWDDMIKQGHYYKLQMQAWSIVYFMTHAEGGKYLPELQQYIVALRSGKRIPVRKFYKRLNELRPQYEKWWLARSLNPTMEGLEAYYETAVATLTSFLARAHGMKQTFETADEFIAAARDGTLKLPTVKSKMWLPESLLKQNLARIDSLTWDTSSSPPTWKLDKSGKFPKLVMTRADGVIFTGQFLIKKNRVSKVTVTITRPDAETD
ncbi:hypothetical protein LCGC14_0225790 [marine sediment metagenome]|uniref:DUF1570 domain-containing protein n=1 Tax=marine sediment metagenome TaxID=412755 RepID=A0A0F9WW61_9ZZZZ|nr:hypothetical protein [Phycisphaerae bacterium]HDZ42967.1 hypothetical protein [Phycisphaerae bacterium]